MVIVVHEVWTFGVAEALAAAGVDIVVLGTSELQAERWVQRWDRKPPRARLVVALDQTQPGVDTDVIPSQLQCVQTTWGPEPPGWLLEGVRNEEFTWILDSVPVELDDDPAWLAGRLTEHAPILPAWAELDLNSDNVDAWPLLRESRDYEIGVRDLDELAARTPLVFRVPLDLHRFDEMSSLLPHAHGWSLTLPASAGLEDVNEVIRVVRYVRGVEQRADAGPNVRRHPGHA